MGERGKVDAFSHRAPGEAHRFLVVIDHVLALGYLKPDLRRRVIRLQRRLIQEEMASHYQSEEDSANIQR